MAPEQEHRRVMLDEMTEFAYATNRIAHTIQIMQHRFRPTSRANAVNALMLGLLTYAQDMHEADVPEPLKTALAKWHAMTAMTPEQEAAYIQRCADVLETLPKRETSNEPEGHR